MYMNMANLPIIYRSWWFLNILVNLNAKNHNNYDRFMIIEKGAGRNLPLPKFLLKYCYLFFFFFFGICLNNSILNITRDLGIFRKFH